jgi:hypothetical protein
MSARRTEPTAWLVPPRGHAAKLDYTSAAATNIAERFARLGAERRALQPIVTELRPSTAAMPRNAADVIALLRPRGGQRA